MINTNRLEKVLASMKNAGLYQFMITDPQSIYYLTNINIHPGNRFFGLYVNQDKKHFLVNNALFPLKDTDLDTIWYSDTESAVTKFGDIIKKDEAIGIDKFMASHFLIEMMELGMASAYKNASPHVDYVRMVKDAEEIEKMQIASSLNDKAIGIIIDKIKIGVSELGIVSEIKALYNELGAEGCSFSPIIAFGANAANPHHSSDNTILKSGESVVIDMGCIKNGYCSDMTRTIFSSEPDAESKKVYNIVKEANELAIEAVKPGAKFSDIDNIARGHITEQGYGKYFTHRTGHCIGMSTHEFGDVSAIHHAELKEGMIFSIEPGIYVTGRVGVRIEDLIVVTANGYKNLNSYPKTMIIK